MGRTKDYDAYGSSMSGNDILRRRKPNVFVYQEISDTCGVYEVRVGGGVDVQNLPPFRIYYSTTEGDFVMVKHAKPIEPSKSPLSPTTKGEKAKQEEMAL
jgi:hypothetical protein